MLNKLLVILIVLNIFLSSYWVLNNNLYFHSDIARDFLLMEEIATARKPTLIGARSGGIEGAFHGPLWLYLNLPAFLLGNGNPVAVAWFWVLLGITAIYAVFKVTQKLFGRSEALIASFLMSVYLITPVHHFLNSDGVLLVSPLYFYFFYKYTQKPNALMLAISLLFAGVLVQFQLAFGIPIIILTILYSLIISYRHKTYRHMLAFFVLLIPLSTFVLFDIRHDFLQLNAIVNKLSSGSFSIWRFIGAIVDRIKIAVFRLPLNLTKSLPLLVALLVSLITLVRISDFKSKHRSVINTFLYLYFGYWAIAVFFPGEIAAWYYIGFFPIIFILIGSLFQNSAVYLLIILALVFPRYQSVSRDINNYSPEPVSQPSYTWQFNNFAAVTIFNDAPKEFGYFVLTPDLYGYPPTYAMHFLQKQYPDKTAVNEKIEVTYLLIDESSKNAYANSEVWRQRDLGITSEPIEVFEYKNGFRIEKYNLSDKELASPTNPNLINSTFFR